MYFFKNCDRYYSVGYSVYLFVTYLWFSAILDVSESPWVVLGLDVIRALILGGGCMGCALLCLPFNPSSDSTPRKSQARSRLRLLLFRSAAVVTVVTFVDLPTNFATVFLPNVSGLDTGGQIGVLIVFAALGLLYLPRLDTQLSETNPPSKMSLFGREVRGIFVCK